MSGSQPSVAEEEMRPLTPINRIGYASGDFANNFSWSLVSGYLLFFLTDVAALSATAAGMMMLLPKLFDAITDPVIGTLSDHTRSRWGRYRPWVLFSAGPMLVLNILTFTTFPDWSYGARLAWAAVTYMLLVLFYTMVNVPYSTLPAAITRNGVERSKLASYRMTAAFIAMTVLSYGVVRVVDWAGNGDQARGYQGAAIIFSAIALPFYLWCFLANKERVQVPIVKIHYGRLFHVLKGNTPVWSLLGAFVAWGILQGGLSMRLYFFTYNAGDQLLFANNSTVQSILSVVGAFSVSWLVPRVRNKRTIPVFGFTISAAAFFICFFLPMHTSFGIWAYYVMSAIVGLGSGMILGSLFGMVPDTTEYTILHHKVHAAGFISSFINFAMKVGIALSSAIAGWALGWIGYVAGAQQTESALFWINFASHIFVGICLVAGALSLMFYKLDHATYDRIVAQLEAQGDAQVTSDAQLHDAERP